MFLTNLICCCRGQQKQEKHQDDTESYSVQQSDRVSCQSSDAPLINVNRLMAGPDSCYQGRPQPDKYQDDATYSSVTTNNRPSWQSSYASIVSTSVLAADPYACYQRPQQQRTHQDGTYSSSISRQESCQPLDASLLATHIPASDIDIVATAQIHHAPNIHNLHKVREITHKFIASQNKVKREKYLATRNLWSKTRAVGDDGEEITTGAELAPSMIDLLPVINAISAVTASKNKDKTQPIPVCCIVGRHGDIELMLDACANPQFNQVRVLVSNGTTAYIMENHDRVNEMLTYADPDSLLISRPQSFPDHAKALWRSACAQKAPYTRKVLASKRLM